MPEVIINGSEGRLEGRYHHSATPNAPLALLLHPHPLQGGTMNNRVVYCMFQAFVKRGFSALRFNFRGVGRSQGGYGRGEGELADAASALDWLQTVNPDAPGAWIGGFSFGAWIGMQLLMRRPEISGFISISPPANMYDFTFLAPCPSSGLILHGDADDIVPQPDLKKLVDKLSLQKGITITYENIRGADHVYQNHMPQLTTAVDRYLDRVLGVGVAAQ